MFQFAIRAGLVLIIAHNHISMVPDFYFLFKSHGSYTFDLEKASLLPKERHNIALSRLGSRFLGLRGRRSGDFGFRGWWSFVFGEGFPDWLFLRHFCVVSIQV
jgi:hypothetical protein